ncbi:MAG: hypothetical protein WC560_04030 [Syntrophales bacterium]
MVLKPVSHGEILEIRVWLSKFGYKSSTIRQEVFIKGTDTLVCDADVSFVIVDKNTNKAIPLTDDIRASIEPMMN